MFTLQRTPNLCNILVLTSSDQIEIDKKQLKKKLTVCSKKKQISKEVKKLGNTNNNQNDPDKNDAKSEESS